MELQLNKKEVFKALQNSETYGTVLHALALYTIGEEIYEIDSVELYARFEDMFGTLPHEDNESKLMSIIIAVSTPFFYKDLEVFNTVCKTLTTGDPGLTDIGFADITVLDIFWGLYEVGLNAEAIPFSTSIQNLMSKIIQEEALEQSQSKQDISDQYSKAVKENAVELHSQLNKLGFSEVPQMPNV